MTKLPSLLIAFALLSSTSVLLVQAPVTLTIDASKPVSTVSPILYGLMTEEINYSYDGGLYPEMVRNRSVLGTRYGADNWSSFTHGNARADMANDPAVGPSKALPASLRLNITRASEGNGAGVANGGFWGMAVRPQPPTPAPSTRTRRAPVQRPRA